MTTISETPVSVEGKKILITGLKINPLARPTFLKGSGELVFPLSVSRRGKSVILEEYKPKEYKIKPSSLLDAGSAISGTHLWGFSSNPVGPEDIIRHPFMGIFFKPCRP